MRFSFGPGLLQRLRDAHARRGHGDDRTRDGHTFLVSSGLGPVLYLTDDGRVLSDSSDFDGPPLGEASDDEAVVTMVVAAERFELPELLELLPAPPADASTCPTCGGTRRVTRPTRMICYRCSGRGWRRWRELLRDHQRDCRALRPIPEPKELAPLALAEHRVQGGFLDSWLRRHGPAMLAERTMLFEDHGKLAPEPLIVFHGDPGCLAAVRILLGASDGRIVALFRDEYDDFLQRHPERREFDQHVSSWSYFQPASPELLKGRRLDPALEYRNHVNGTLWAPRCGLEVENLWSWDGHDLLLIEEAIVHRRF